MADDGQRDTGDREACADDGGGQVQPGHGHAGDDERDPGQGRVTAGEEQRDDAVRVGGPGPDPARSTAVAALVEGLLHHVQDLRQDQRTADGDDRQRSGAEPVQRQDQQEVQAVEGEDHLDRGAGQGERGAQDQQDEGSDHHLGDRLAARPAGLGGTAAGDQHDREAGQEGEERGSPAVSQFHEEAGRSTLGGIGADVGRVHPEDREPPGEVHSDQAPHRGPGVGELRGCVRLRSGRGHERRVVCVLRHGSQARKNRRSRSIRQTSASHPRTTGTDPPGDRAVPPERRTGLFPFYGHSDDNRHRGHR